MEDIKNLFKSIKDDVKDELFEKLDDLMDKDEKIKPYQEKKKEILEKLIIMDDFLDKEFENLDAHFTMFQKTFKMDKLKIEADVISAFSQFNEFENNLLSMFLRNNRYYTDFSKMEKIISKLLLKIYKNCSIEIPKKQKELQLFMDEDEIWSKYKSVDAKFKTFFKNYEELAEKIKQKGYMVKNYMAFLQFSRGNDAV